MADEIGERGFRIFEEIMKQHGLNSVLFGAMDFPNGTLEAAQELVAISTIAELERNRIFQRQAGRLPNLVPKGTLTNFQRHKISEAMAQAAAHISSKKFELHRFDWSTALIERTLAVFSTDEESLIRKHLIELSAVILAWMLHLDTKSQEPIEELIHVDLRPRIDSPTDNTPEET